MRVCEVFRGTRHLAVFRMRKWVRIDAQKRTLPGIHKCACTEVWGGSPGQGPDTGAAAWRGARHWRKIARLTDCEIGVDTGGALSARLQKAAYHRGPACCCWRVLPSFWRQPVWRRREALRAPMYASLHVWLHSLFGHDIGFPGGAHCSAVTQACSQLRRGSSRPELRHAPISTAMPWRSPPGGLRAQDEAKGSLSYPQGWCQALALQPIHIKFFRHACTAVLSEFSKNY